MKAHPEPLPGRNLFTKSGYRSPATDNRRVRGTTVLHRDAHIPDWVAVIAVVESVMVVIGKADQTTPTPRRYVVLCRLRLYIVRDTVVVAVEIEII
jgi:hypothetical protein